jgi:asparagine synthase (glutamine-hydrolysing)
MQVVEAQDEPFDSPSVLMQSALMRSVHLAGRKVLMGGQGADELFLGYRRHFFLALAANSWHDKLQLAYLATHRQQISAVEAAGLVFYFSNHCLRRWRQQYRCRGLRPAFQQWLLKNDAERRLWQHAKRGEVFEYQLCELFEVGLPTLLRYEDRNSMSFGVESRLPFLDYRLAELALNLPLAYKYRRGWSKYLLRHCMVGGLPAELVWRKRKAGFEAPAAGWLGNAEPFRQMIGKSSILTAMFHSLPAADRNESLQWRLMSIAAWESVFQINDWE